VTMAMGGEYAIFLIKFQPALHRGSWYLCRVGAQRGLGCVSGWSPCR
jgi:hypothetical protein